MLSINVRVTSLVTQVLDVVRQPRAREMVHRHLSLMTTLG